MKKKVVKKKVVSGISHGLICDGTDQKVGWVEQRNKKDWPRVVIDDQYPQWQALAEMINIRISRSIPLNGTQITTRFELAEKEALITEIRQLSDGRLTFYPD